MRWSNNKYIKEFTDLYCHEDILENLLPIQNIEKEVTEAMAMIRRLRPYSLRQSKTYTLMDFCSGNSLLPAISAFLLKFNNNFAFDKTPRQRDWANISKFAHVELDIYSPIFDQLCSARHIIMTSIHPCGKLAERVIDIFNNSNAEVLFLMPCCSGKTNVDVPQLFKEKLGNYLLWVWHLTGRIKNSNVSIQIDNNCISPKNAIIRATKKKPLT